MVDRTSTRSAGYQQIFVELLCSPEILAECSDSQGLSNSSNYNEELFELQEQLIVEFWRIVNTQLTKRQSEVLNLIADGYTQIEIAKKLGVNQSSVTKSVHGNCDYRNKQNKKNRKKPKKFYGGAKRKILKIASTDPAIQNIFKKINDIKSELV